MRPIIPAIAARCARATGLTPSALTRRDIPQKGAVLPAGLLRPAVSLAGCAAMDRLGQTETVFLQGDRTSFVRPDAVLECIQSLLAARLREIFIRP